MTPYYDNGVTRLYRADARSLPLPDESVHCVVTSPPYWGLRDYGIDGGIGLEPTVEEYVAALVQVGREIRRVLRDDGSLWLNVGDVYSAAPGERGSRGTRGHDSKYGDRDGRVDGPNRRHQRGLKPKDLCGVPWRVAFALQADGWWLRSDIIWAKPNPMPESVKDRPTRSHEYLFLLTKSARYYYDADAIREPAKDPADDQRRLHRQHQCNKSAATTERNGLKPRADKQRGHGRRHAGFNDRWDGMSRAEQQTMGANKRDVWTIATRPYAGAHFATFPEQLIEPCILAGTSEAGVCAGCGTPWARAVERRPSTMNIRVRDAKKGILDRKSGFDVSATDAEMAGYGPEMDGASVTAGWRPNCGCDAADPIPATVLDPFAGSGTTCAVAQRLGRRSAGVDLNLDYLDLSVQRLQGIPLPLT